MLVVILLSASFALANAATFQFAYLEYGLDNAVYVTQINIDGRTVSRETFSNSVTVPISDKRQWIALQTERQSMAEQWLFSNVANGQDQSLLLDGTTP